MLLNKTRPGFDRSLAATLEQGHDLLLLDRRGCRCS